MSIKRNSIAQQLHAAQVAIDNTVSSAQIQDRVAAFGYGTDHMQIGRSLLGAAVAATASQKAAAGAQQNATAQLKLREKEAFAAYQDLAKVARAVFLATPARLVTLGLNTKMPRATAEFIIAAFRLFDNAQLKAELADFGYGADRLASEREKITAYEQANSEQESAKGAAQHATQSQRAALKACTDWTRQYLKIARVALRGREQLLEKLGVKVRVSKTAAQRQGPKKAAATRAAKKAVPEEEVETGPRVTITPIRARPGDAPGLAPTVP